MAEKYFAQPSVMSAQQHFSEVPGAEIQRSRFDRSHGHKTTFDAGMLIPFLVDEVLPGDTFDINSTHFGRLATPLKPIMDNIFLDVHYFFVPNRIIWDEFQQFMGERLSPNDDPDDILHPVMEIDAIRTGSDPASYFGIPNRSGSTNKYQVSALPFRAYVKIYNDWYRDQNLSPLQTEYTGSGVGPGLNSTLARNKRHDYFTSCLPWPQKGDPVFIPIATSAEVVSDGGIMTMRGMTEDIDRTLQVSNASGSSAIAYTGATMNPAQNAKWGSATGLMVDLTNATAVTINDLRTAFQIQRLLERDARGGTRYIELVLSHFGVRSDDGRLQRPEYLGGGTAMVNINPIASTFAAENQPQADLAAFGTVNGRAGVHKSFTEHGILMGIMSARADVTYQNGIERLFSRRTRYDYYWPALANLGEQPVYGRELVARGFAAGVEDPADAAVFGYQERYAEYRYKPSRITGLFQSSHAQSLDVWHLSQDLEAVTPTLNPLFLLESPAIDRVIAVPSEPHFLMDIWISMQCTRPMPVYSVPGMIDHF